MKNRIFWGMLGIIVLVLGLGTYGFVKIHQDRNAHSKKELREKKVDAIRRQEQKVLTLLKQATFLSRQYNYEKAIQLLITSNQSTNEQVTQKISQLREEQAKLKIWKDNLQISHLFFHSLIKDTKKAFDGDSKQNGYNEYMATIAEFNHSLEQLYANQYVLVNIHDIAEVKDGKMICKEIRLPDGKKPLVLSQDDVSYYEYMKGDGFAANLTISKENKITNTYTDDGKVEYGSFDMVPLLDDFVAAHPDFSYRGAKGIIALTGYNGVLGYRTSISEYGDNQKTKTEIEQAKKVATFLRDDGWEFASHTWGHLNAGKVSTEQLKADTERWENEVKPVIGNTDILIYPFGSDVGDWQSYVGNPKFDYLHSKGFNFFCNVDGSTSYWMQLGDNYLRQARINIDGIKLQDQMTNKTNVLTPFIDAAKTWDPARPKLQE